MRLRFGIEDTTDGCDNVLVIYEKFTGLYFAEIRYWDCSEESRRGAMWKAKYIVKSLNAKK